MNFDSEFERKFVPKGSIKCGKKCFDIVDKWCTRILTKSETGDNWNKIIEREICLMKIKYPFLSEKQIRGRALQKFGIPNSMGDIVRCGINRVKGNLARELNHLNVKKEPRIPPPFRMMRRIENVEKVKRELLTQTEKNPEMDEDPIDENFNLTPRKKQSTNPRKCLLKRFRLLHESDTDDETTEQPRKRIKIEQIDLHEIQENSKYYISQDKSVNQSFLEESTNENGDDDSNNNSQMEENLQMKRMIYSQFSESGKKYLTSFSDWRLTQEDKQSQQTVFNHRNNTESTPSECDYSPAAASPIVPEKSRNSSTFMNHHQRSQENHKLLMKNPVYSGNKKVEMSFFTIPKKSMNNSKDKDVMMNRNLKEIQKSSDTNINSITNQYFSSSNFGGEKIDSDSVSRLDECFSDEDNYFDKENECPSSKRGIFNEKRSYKPLFEVSNDKNRRILGDINFPLIEINSDVSEIDSNASTQVISQNNDKDSSRGEQTQSLDEMPFSLPENSSGKVLSEISQNIEQNLNSNEILSEEQVLSGNKKVEKSFFTIPEKSMNNSKDKDVLINRNLQEIQKSSDTNINSITNQYFSASNFGREKINSNLVSRLDECFSDENHYFDKENECPRSKRGIFNENRSYKPLFEVSNDKSRTILGEINFPLIEINSDVSEIDSNASTQVISQNNDKDSSRGEQTQPLDEMPFSLPENSSGKVLSEISQNTEQNLNSNEISSVEQLTQLITQSSLSLSPLPTDNSQDNPWLNLTSQDFSQNDHNYSQRDFTQDSGKATQDSIVSDFSFMTVSSSNSAEIDTGSLQDLFHAKMATIKRAIAIILSELEKEALELESQGD